MTAPLDYRSAKEKLAGVLGQPLTTPVADLMVMAADQLDNLFLAHVAKGFQDAIDTLREAAENANTDGPDRNLDRWAIYLAGASFLDSHVKWHDKTEVCKCRCQEGRHCGGCGHEGCGYQA